MKILRTAATLGIAKKLYDEARKPQNQQRMKDAVARLQAQRAKGRKR